MFNNQVLFILYNMMYERWIRRHKPELSLRERLEQLPPDRLYGGIVMEMRKERGLTQKDVATRLGMSQSHQSYTEAGIVYPQSQESVSAMADAIGAEGDHRDAMFIAARMIPEGEKAKVLLREAILKVFSDSGYELSVTLDKIL